MTCCSSRELQRVLPQWPEESSGRPTALLGVGVYRDYSLVAEVRVFFSSWKAAKAGENEHTEVGSFVLGG